MRFSIPIMVVIMPVILFLATSCGLVNFRDVSQKKTVLSGTVWTSKFYYYCNQYFFKTDSTGYSQDGQLAWSTLFGQDTSNHIPQDSILYIDNDTFKYLLIDTVLIINYLSPEHDSTNDTRIFFRRPMDSAFVSEYEYVYGREVLYKKK
jgi:hypothetical protein